MSISPEYQHALDILSQAANAMTQACNAYEVACSAADNPELISIEIDRLRIACNDARAAHDEALADAWEMIESQSS